jgi:hypothetical protein
LSGGGGGRGVCGKPNNKGSNISNSIISFHLKYVTCWEERIDYRMMLEVSSSKVRAVQLLTFIIELVC